MLEEEDVDICMGWFLWSVVLWGNFTVISLRRSFPDVGNLKTGVVTSLKRSFPGVDDLKTGSGSTLGFTIPEVDSKMIPGVDNHGWSNFLAEMTPKSTVESL